MADVAAMQAAAALQLVVRPWEGEEHEDARRQHLHADEPVLDGVGVLRAGNGARAGGNADEQRLRGEGRQVECISMPAPCSGGSQSYGLPLSLPFCNSDQVPCSQPLIQQQPSPFSSNRMCIQPPPQQQ